MYSDRNPAGLYAPFLQKQYTPYVVLVYTSYPFLFRKCDYYILCRTKQDEVGDEIKELAKDESAPGQH